MHNIDNNPLLAETEFPQFDLFHVEHIRPAIEFLIEKSKADIQVLAEDPQPASWENFVEQLELINNRFEKVWGPIGHLDAVKNSDDWHDAYTDCLDKVTQYHAEVGQHKTLYAKFASIYESESFNHLDLAQKKVIEHAIRDFKLGGVALDDDRQNEYKSLKQSLSQSSSQFGNNVLKATQSWFRQIDDVELLSGLPESSIGLLKQLAEQKNLKGWCVTLDFPSYLAVMTYADNRALREEVYKAFSTRASDQSEHKEFDNSELISSIRRDRHQLAKLLGFEHYADYSLATKMAESTDSVLHFLRELAEKSRPQAEAELKALREYAKQHLALDQLEPWDFSYAAEKLKSDTLSLSQETLRPYFPVEKVLSGLFSVTKQLFNVTIEEVFEQNTWHDDVRFFALKDENDATFGHFYLDLYAREHKRGGAWMDSAVTRWKHPDGHLQNPVAYLVCNFTPPVNGQEACLTHDEVTTLFHEFGHGIHHLFTKVEQLDVSGISGVPWDAVELPSQFMENFCWEREGLNLISSHIDSGETLPESLLQALKKGRGFQSAMMMLRQLEFALTDFEMHCSYNPENPEEVLSLVNRIRAEIAVVMPPEYNRMINSFSHIFAGGYAAGYYSYKWAEVLSADAFSLFEEQGILNTETGMKFKNTILSAGGSVNPMTLFKAFRGREPNIEALLRHSAIAS